MAFQCIKGAIGKLWGDATGECGNRIREESFKLQVGRCRVRGRGNSFTLRLPKEAVGA